MDDRKFDPKKLQKLNNPQRLLDIPPDALWNKLQLKEPRVLVEIGAGTAVFSVAFSRISKGLMVYACDLSAVMVDWMNEKIAPNYPDIIPVKSEEYSVPLDDEIADLVFMINLHHELNDPLLTLEEAMRLLKNQGKILIVDWKKQEMSEGPPIGIRCLPGEVIDQLNKCGFERVHLDETLEKHFIVVGKKDKH